MSDSPDSHDEDEPIPSASELEAAGQESMFAAPAPPPPVAALAASNQPYRVLARKYRPQTFSQLIGQEAMVQTLSNAIKRDRLAHAFLMTGVRGVGKTSTARLIAKALNCIGPDGQGGPTIETCGVCEPCVAIAEGRHIDVIEMDAASHNGIDDVRAMTDAVRYATVSARFKIYIIDEVHMMSKPAFNALLKTLEEPPPHVKFLFATTEADKLPVTVLSRCQRFDLRRIDAGMLTEHFAAICRAEGVEAEGEALSMIANASEGSVRDGLSILDQAIAHADLGGDGKVNAEQVRDMLGLADKTAQRRLLAALLAGDGPGLLELIDAQFALGVEPLAMLRSVMDLVHRVTVTQVGKLPSEAISAEERAAIDDWAARLTGGQLHRLWQLLLKGYDEVKTAPDPLIAARMALLRVLHATDLPDPGSLVKQLEELAARTPAVTDAKVASSAVPETAVLNAAAGWADLVDRVDQTGQLRVAQIMRDWVQVIELTPLRLFYAVAPGYPGDPSSELRDALLRATGERWEVQRGEGKAQPSLREADEVERNSAKAAVLAASMVQAAFAAFPQAELVDESTVARPDDNNWRNRA
jgi:DNA polymerase-3 subunit gamma/tau